MIIDNELVLSDEQDLAGLGPATVVSENVIDTSVARDIAKGEPVYLIITCDLGVTVADSVEFQLISATEEDLTTGQKILATTGAILIADLTKGRTPIVLPLPPMMAGMDQQYIGVAYTILGTVTAGKFTAFLGIGPHTNI